MRLLRQTRYAGCPHGRSLGLKDVSPRLAPCLSRTHGNKSTLLQRKAHPCPSRQQQWQVPLDHPLTSSRRTIPYPKLAVPSPTAANSTLPERHLATWRQPPQTFGHRHTNGHGSVGAYNTAPTSPTTRRPPGPVRGGDRAAQPAGLHPPPAGPPTHPRPEPVHRPSDQTWGCTTQWTAPTSTGPLSLVAQAMPTATATHLE